MKKQTRKDWQKRTWPAGTNDVKNKRFASQLVRRKNKELDEEIPQGSGYKKAFEHYDINDFK